MRLVKFLLRRQNSKGVILQVCKQMLLPGQQARLPVISDIVDMLNAVYKIYLDTEMQMLVSVRENLIVCVVRTSFTLYINIEQNKC